MCLLFHLIHNEHIIKYPVNTCYWWLYHIYHVHIHYRVTLMLGPALSPCSPSDSEIHLSYTSVWPPCSQVLGLQGIGLGGSTLLLGSHQVLWKLPGSWDCSCREGNYCGQPRWHERPGVWATWNLREESCPYLTSTFRKKKKPTIKNQPCASSHKHIYRPLRNLDFVWAPDLSILRNMSTRSVTFWSKYYEWSPRPGSAQEEHAWNCLWWH